MAVQQGEAGAGALQELETHGCFGGRQMRFCHQSRVLDCRMNFALYLPPQVAAGVSVPVLYWLSGLTCTEENFIHKAGAQRQAAALGVALVVPDTSPRGEAVADDPAYDLGQGAGFYLNATRAPWSSHYRMYDYVLWELPALVEAHFPVTDRRALSGHSMGGHGALVLGLHNPERYASLSAFSPIGNPMRCPWGQKAFRHYLGEWSLGDKVPGEKDLGEEDAHEARWRAYDASELLRSGGQVPPLRIDIGLDDPFLESQLRPEALEAGAQAGGHDLALEYHPGYDHSYFFVASFIDAHLRFHARHLGV